MNTVYFITHMDIMNYFITYMDIMYNPCCNVIV